MIVDFIAHWIKNLRMMGPIYKEKNLQLSRLGVPELNWPRIKYLYFNEQMDTLGIEPNTSRRQTSDVLSERDNQLHHVPSALRPLVSFARSADSEYLN